MVSYGKDKPIYNNNNFSHVSPRSTGPAGILRLIASMTTLVKLKQRGFTIQRVQHGLFFYRSYLVPRRLHSPH
jgi:hypothetical protein